MLVAFKRLITIYESMNKLQLLEYLDTYLKTSEFKDSSKNGLQVDNELDEISKIWYAVDCTDYLIDKAIEQWVTMMIVHHWLYWGIETPMTWIMYKRMKKLLDHNIALYASHLPLDAHEVVGNNIWLLQWWTRIFWIEKFDQQWFWTYKDKQIGFWIRYEMPVHVATLHTSYCTTLWLRNQFYNFWKHEYIKSVAFASGQGWFAAITEAARDWYDLLITGEAVHYEITLAKELWLSILLWWHYETEKIWPKLLAHHIKKELWIDVTYLDECY